MRFSGTSSAIVFALALMGCGEPDPEPFPRHVVLDVDLAATHGEDVIRAFNVWNESFPGCRHDLVGIANLERSELAKGDIGFGPDLPSRPNSAARYSYEGRWIEVLERAVELDGVAGAIIHELGHGHGMREHTATGLMAEWCDPKNETIDPAMVAGVCAADPRCCDG